MRLYPLACVIITVCLGLVLVSGLLQSQTPGTVTVGVTVSAVAGKISCIISNPAPSAAHLECSEQGVKKLIQDIASGAGSWSSGTDTISWVISSAAWSVTANGVTKNGNF